MISSSEISPSTSRPVEAIVFPGERQVEFRTLELPPCAPDDVVLRTHYTMVSSGTELRVLGGHYGAASHFPVIPGYSAIGEVIEVGAAAQGWRVGDLVSARNPRDVPGIHSQWGGQASFHRQPSSGPGQPVLLPTGAAPLDYVVAEIGAISWRGANSTEARPGETAIVIGQGLVGALSAWWLQSLGCRVVVTDVADSRLQRALNRGASAGVNARDPHCTDRLRGLIPGGADIVVESSGTSAGLRQAFAMIRPEGPARSGPRNWPRLLLQANYLEEIPVNLFSFFDGEGVRLLTPTDRRLEDREAVVEKLRKGVIKSADFVDRVLPWKQAPTAYAELLDQPDRHFSLVFDWTQ